MKASKVALTGSVIVVALGVTACGGTSLRAANIGAARRSNFDFRIFPTKAASAPCQIPRGGLSGEMRIAGTCTTEVRTFHPPEGIHGGHGTVGIVEVVFTQRWRDPPSSPKWSHTAWIVDVRGGHVLAGDTRQVGVIPPQSWR